MFQEWKPRWGYKRAGDDTKDWLIEVPDTAGECVSNVYIFLFVYAL